MSTTVKIPYNLTIGREYKYVPDMKHVLKESASLYEFIMAPLIHPRLYRTERSMQKNPLQLTRSQIRFDSSEKSTHKSEHRFATIKPSIDLESSVDHIRERAEYTLTEEVELSEFLGIKGIVFDLPIFPEIEDYFPFNF